ncbi:hypothetical protein ACS0TY_000674 [Phlomoides rotata]
MATDDVVDVLQRLATQIFGHFQIDDKDIRGVGLQVSKLEGANDSKSGLDLLVLCNCSLGLESEP